MTLTNGTKIDVNYYPGFVRKSVTFTLDDGIYQYDKKVVDILKPYGFTGTFNINNPATVTDPAIYDGFEVANHHILHAVAVKPDYAAREMVNEYLPTDADTAKVYLASRTVDGEKVDGMYYVYIGSSWHPMAADETYIKYLEWTTEKLDKMFGEGTIVGFAYPHGNQYNDAIIAYLKEAGYLYGRRTGNLKASTGFALPRDRYTWTYNADHNCLLTVMADYDKYADDGTLKMFSFGVHAKDFETGNKWGDLETFAKTYGNRPEDFWYATNRQIFEYEDAIKALEISEEKIVNPSPVTVYITVNNEKVIIPAMSAYYLDGDVKANVIFDADNGTENAFCEVKVGSFAEKPEDPKKDGFIFDGWYANGEKWSFNTRIVEGIVLKAKYTAEPFKGTSAEVLPVKGGAGGIVSIIHDDGRSPSGYILDELFYKYSLVGDVALLTNNVYNATTETKKAEYDNWKRIIDTGRWGIISHSITHTWWGNVTKDADGNNVKWERDDAKMNDEIVKSQTILRNLFPGHRVLTFAYPGFSAEKSGLTAKQYLEIIYDEDSRALIDQYYISARNSTETGPAYVTENSNWLYLDAFFLNPSRIDGTGSGSLLNRLESAANDGRIHMISMHAVSNDVEPGTTGYTLSTVDVDKAMKLISEYSSSGKVWNAHYEDAILYVREAQNATATANGDENGITVTLTDTMNNDIYNYPLTVRVTVPGAWEAVKITQGESTSYAAVKYLDGKFVIDADIVPDGGEATLVGVSKKDIPYTPAKKPTPPASSVLPEAPVTPPTSLLDKEVTVGFETDPGVTANSSGTVAYVSRGEGKALQVVDSLTTAMGGCRIPLGNTCTPEALSVTFDINVAQATSFAANIFFASDSSKTPYLISLVASGSGYYLGDCQSTSSAGQRTNNLTGATPLEFNKWYTIKIDVIFTSVEDFKAVWYVDGTKTGESTNRANHSKTEGAALQNTVNNFAVNTLKSAIVDMQLDNVVMKAGSAAMLGLDGSTVIIGNNFDSGIAGVDNKKPESVKVESVDRNTANGDKALKIDKYATGTAQVVTKGAEAVTDAKEFTYEFDINLESSNATTLIQIFFNTTIANSPIDFTLRGHGDGYSFGVLNSYSGGSSSDFGGTKKLLTYGKYYHVKLHVVIGDADSFAATLYIDGESAGTTSVFLNPNKEDGYQPSTSLNGINYYTQSAATFVMYLDNVTLVAK